MQRAPSVIKVLLLSNTNTNVNTNTNTNTNRIDVLDYASYRMAIFYQGQIQTQIPIVGLSVQVKGGRRWRIDYARCRVGGRTSASTSTRQARCRVGASASTSASVSTSTRCRRCVVGKPRAQGHTKMQHEDNNKVASANFQDHLRGLTMHWGRSMRPENGF